MNSNSAKKVNPIYKKYKNIDELFEEIGTTPDKRNNLLEYIKRNDNLKKDLYDKTKCLDGQYLVQPLSQRIFHYVNKMCCSVPKTKKGWYARYKNFTKGYDLSLPQHVRNCEWSKLTEAEIETYILSSNGGIKHKILKEWLVKKTSFLDPFNASIKLRSFYFRKNLIYPIVDYRTGKLAYLFSDKQIKKFKPIIEHFLKLTEEKKLSYFKHVQNLKNREKVRTLQTLRFCFPIVEYLERKTKNIPGLSEDKNISLMIWHFVNDMQSLPLCKHCNNPISCTKFNAGLSKYPLTCSHECNNKCIEIIEKRLKNNSTNHLGYNTNIGENEKYLLNLLSKTKNLTIEYNKQIGPYFVDGFDNIKGLVIEIQEKHHCYSRQFEKDKKKIDFVLNKGYKVILVLDNWYNPKARTHSFQKNYERYFSGLNGVSILKINTFEGKVLTDIGWSKFMDVHLTKHENVLVKFKTKKRELTCTADHLLFSSNLYYKPANEYKIGDVVQTIDGQEKITNIEFVNKNQKVYDLIETENNAFFANGIKVHNCVLLDEAAHIECLHKDSVVKVKNKHTNETKIVSLNELNKLLKSV